MSTSYGHTIAPDRVRAVTERWPRRHDSATSARHAISIGARRR
jgi:hypothetical protein